MAPSPGLPLEPSPASEKDSAMRTSRAIIIAGALIAAAITATVIDSPRPPQSVYVTDGGGGFFVIYPATKDMYRCRLLFDAEMHCAAHGKHP